MDSISLPESLEATMEAARLTHLLQGSQGRVVWTGVTIGSGGSLFSAGFVSQLAC